MSIEDPNVGRLRQSVKISQGPETRQPEKEMSRSRMAGGLKVFVRRNHKGQIAKPENQNRAYRVCKRGGVRERILGHASYQTSKKQNGFA